jgi:sugar O-acyltransferase (sialic acid O-acetyltransferase NeuD family)
MQKTTIEIIGYSGHSYVCIEAAINSGFEIVGYYDIEEKSLNPYQIKYLGSENEISCSTNSFFVAIGDNQLREFISEKLSVYNNFATLIHPSTIISSTSKVADNVLVSAGAVINAKAKIGFGCIINTSAIVEHECDLSDYVHIAPGAVLAGNVSVGKRSFIGANATVKQGITIGEDVIIGAGAVIINDVPRNSTVVGNPGKIIKARI